MSDLMLQPHTLAGRQASHPAQQADRRRPGRMANPSPELIQLMRKPTTAARARVALYDPPGFLLQPQVRRPRAHGRSLVHTMVAATACSAATAAMFQGMLFVWG